MSEVPVCESAGGRGSRGWVAGEGAHGGDEDAVFECGGADLQRAEEGWCVGGGWV